MISAPPLPARRLCVGVTGHRTSHAGLSANRALIEQSLAGLFRTIAHGVASAPEIPGSPLSGRTRLHCLLADGADQIAARLALSMGWDLVCPLPFGRRLNLAINSAPCNRADALAILAGQPVTDRKTAARVQEIGALYAEGRLFELADRDAVLSALFLARFSTRPGCDAGRLFNAEIAQRSFLAGAAMVEQSDIVIAVWDGASVADVGGTGHTMATALECGAPVIWIDPAEPEKWRILHAPESLAARSAGESSEAPAEALLGLVRRALDPDGEAPRTKHPGDPGLATLAQERWRDRSNPFAHGYRRIEALFGDDPGESPFRSIRQHYEEPEAIGSGTGAPLLAEITALPGGDPELAEAIDRAVLRRFAWADGISARLSDAYRGGMIVNFLLSSLAVAGGIIYLPFFSAEGKWPFAVLELMLVLAILAITAIGQRRHWHTRWFETRRVAEYLRHSPLLILLGVARPPGRWPRGTTSSWPEWYARQAIREVGLPEVAVTSAYLRQALEGPLVDHVAAQRDYHFAKAHRLKRVHHRLDVLSGALFLLAVVSVVVYLGLKLATAASRVDGAFVAHASKYFTLAGVIFPSFASAIAGIRFFGDFERFAAISEVAAEKLDAIHSRIALLRSAPDDALDYASVAQLAHATDAIVIAEIESWQSVFGGKQISIPA